MAILGIDEVGRGPLAGPLVVGAVVLPEARPEWVEKLKDSKKLTARKREELARQIMIAAGKDEICQMGVAKAEGVGAPVATFAPGLVAVGLGWVGPAELDAVGVSMALKLATRRAVEEVQRQKIAFSQIVIDGKVNFLSGTALEKYVSTAVKADDLVKEVSAASIVAKVARDQYMYEAGRRFPGYGFEKHVGYGTAAHLEALARLGVCPEHRRSFEPIKTMTGFSCERAKKQSPGCVGVGGEEAVSEYLLSGGHVMVARNFKTYFCEIDLVTVMDGKIYFTEVKTRGDEKRGGGMGAVDERKLAQMKFAAECFLYFNKQYNRHDPQLAVASVKVQGDTYIVQEWVPLV